MVKLLKSSRRLVQGLILLATKVSKNRKSKKSAIRHFFKSQHHSEAASLGKQLLEQAIKQAMLQSGLSQRNRFHLWLHTWVSKRAGVI